MATADPTRDAAREITKGRLPNFLLIGAPKAGSTALYYYLEQHPDIFLSAEKEAHFFGDEGVQWPRAVRDLDAYCALFEGVTTERIWGECTPNYLRWPSAALQIKALVPQVKLLAILRNPVDRAYSQHVFLNRGSRHAAVDKGNLPPLEDYNTLAQQLPPSFGRPQTDVEDVLGLRASFYAEDLQRYFDLFGRDQLKVLLYQDLKRDPVATLQSVFEFLGIDPTFVPNMARKHNVTSVARLNWLDNFLVGANPLKVLGKALLPPGLRKNLVQSIYQANLKAYEPLQPETRAWLIEIFRSDILKTQDLLNRDLSGWLH
uniref:Sulfotransferase n=1 Tax=Cyanothece sp. (strain PCC 7425 / ATCC 29141) TaxID=395961 RepID=B8HLJ3_CYAP4